MKISRKVKILLSIVSIVAVAGIAFAWVASNTLYFQTTLSGVPFSLSVLSSYASPTVLSSPYGFPSSLYYGEPVTLDTLTTNLGGAQSGVYTNYEIWISSGSSFPTDSVTVTVQDCDASGNTAGYPAPTTLTFGTLGSASGVSDQAPSGYFALVASIGPYSVPAAPWSAYATVTVTFNPDAPATTFGAAVWVSVGTPVW